MGSYKHERSTSLSPHTSNFSSNGRLKLDKLNNGYQQMNASSMSGYQPSSVTSPQKANMNNERQAGRCERGVVEKLLSSYGFIECESNNMRVFFHYSEYRGDVQLLQVGDSLSFELTSDPRNGKLLAVNVQQLPQGTVAVEQLSEEQCVGRVEVEPKPTKNGELLSPSMLGRVSYDRSGEFFFLPFSYNDMEKGRVICKGDSVTFHVSTNKRTGSLKARKVKYLDPSAKVSKVQGIISSLKESFGFIERADIVAEIFFHYSEYSGEIADVTIGDDVEFELCERQGKEIAVSVKKLPAGTVVFEDITPERLRGIVIKSVASRSSHSVDGHLSGMIEYQGKTDTHEVLFGDRDSEDEIILQKGDVVEFNISTDRRDKLQRAVNIKLITVCVRNGQTRETGAISSLKEGFGFIKCADRDMSIFFHFSEVLEQSHILNVGDEVEFSVEEDSISRRQHATRIRFLPKGTVLFEVVSKHRIRGVVEQEAPMRTLKSPSKTARDQEFGRIRAVVDGVESDVLYRNKDCSLRGIPHHKDTVEFALVTRKSNNVFFAREISVVATHEKIVNRGFICALKETFAFIELEDHSREVFFHYSEFSGDPNQLELGDVVEFVENRRGERPSADAVTRISSCVADDDVLPTLYDGTIIRPMRTVDPEQDEYEGIVEVLSDSPESRREDEEVFDDKNSRGVGRCGEGAPQQFRFGITSIVNKKEPLQAGDLVTFQLCIDKKTQKRRVANMQSRRKLMRARVESIKGQFGFIAHETDDGKSLFFHLSEVIDDNGAPLQPGDEVQFIVVKAHKNAKRSAVHVQRVRDERPEHLTRRRSHRFSESQANKMVVLRQPRGPDGTTGFKLKRDLPQLSGKVCRSRVPVAVASEMACC